MMRWDEIKNWLVFALRGAASSAIVAGVGYLAANYVNAPIPEPWKQIIAMFAVALWSKFRP